MSGFQVRLGNVTHPVADIASAVDFYHSSLGLTTKFVDGERYAALDVGGVTLALAAAEEDLTKRAAASFKVSDVAAAVSAIEQAGGAIVCPAEQGPHETRAVVADPWGNLFIVYGPAGQSG